VVSTYPARKRNWQLPVARCVELGWGLLAAGRLWWKVEGDSDSVSANESEEGRAEHHIE